ncbi:MAG TPA: polysaccharide biosynthesis C-terminal domain-containing protein [Pilimelia sp.]|nr:polysaccharide biosynthesis C-terminal domain-containing protein [Pilimelia sp.]
MSKAVRSAAPVVQTRTAGAGSPASVRPWVARRTREPYVQLLIAQTSAAAGALVANLLIARALAPAGRGWIALLLQVSYLASQLLLLGTERSFVAVYSGSPAAVAARAYFRLAAGPCAAGLAAVAAIAWIAPASVRPPWTIFALVASFTIVNVFVLAIRAIAIATGQTAAYVRYTAVGQVILLTTMGALHLGGVTSPSVWFLAYVLAGVLPTFVCWMRWWRMAGAMDAAADPERIRAVRREGLALVPASIANMGMLRFDRLMLPALASTTALGLYATVATMTQLVSWPLQAFADSRLGTWRAAHGRGWLRPSPLVVSAAVYGLIVAPTVGIAIYLLVVPLFGQPYAAGKALVPPLIAAATLYGVSRMTLGLLIAQGRNLMASAAEVCGFAVSIAAYILLIPSYGASGAAYGSLLGYGVCLVVTAAAVRTRGDRSRREPEPQP